MHWETAKSENVGGREEQQDRVELFTARDGADRLLVLADGMGGHAGGAIAAEAVIETTRKVWSAHALNAMEPDELIQRVCKDGHENINWIGAEQGLEPRSTLTLLYTDDRQARWAHVGDSRIYHFRDGALVKRTRDHSVVQMLVDMGKIDDHEMATHPDQNRLTQSLGGDTTPEPDFESAKIQPGDGFLLCSDGLWEVVSTDEMSQALNAVSIGKSAKKLAKAAAQRGGKSGDNVSVAMARLVGAEASRPNGARAPDRAKRRTGLALFGLVGLAALAAAAVAIWMLGPGADPNDTTPAALSPAPIPARPEKPAPPKPEIPRATLPQEPESKSPEATPKNATPPAEPRSDKPAADPPEDPGETMPAPPRSRSATPDVPTPPKAPGD